jgi:hypothetical protein
VKLLRSGYEPVSRAAVRDEHDRTMTADASDICTGALRIAFALLLLGSLRWMLNGWRDEPQLRVHCLSHAAMSAAMIYMTLPPALQPVPLTALAPVFVALAATIVWSGLRDRRQNATPGLDVCVACAPAAAGSLGAAWMLVMPMGAAAAAPLAVSFALAGALRGGTALAVAVDGDVARERLVSPRSGACTSCCCSGGASCGCDRPAPPARTVALRQASYCAMSIAMAVMLILMDQPAAGTAMHMHMH